MDTLYPLGWAGICFALLQGCVTLHILWYKEDVRGAIGWIGLVWLAPVLGSIFYVLFGINRIRRKALALGTSRGELPSAPPAAGAVGPLPEALRQLVRLGYAVHPQHFTAGNVITPLSDGDNAYPAMCRRIAAARREVLLQSYIFGNDAAGECFVRALARAVQNGARVRVLVDGVGVNYTRPSVLHALKKVRGVRTAVFLPDKRPVSLPFVNLRNHRKILAVDGQYAFFGGMNISADNLLQTCPRAPVSDVTFEVCGPVVGQIARVFAQDWLFAAREAFTPVVPAPYPAAGTAAARVIPDGPDADYAKIAQLLLGVLACVQRQISIVTPYFLPENEMLCALETAARRGVEVEVLVPQKCNSTGMDAAMEATFPRLLRAGVRLYRTAPPFEHTKLCVADGRWVFIGSANWDARSLKLNFECNMECLDQTLALRLEQLIRLKKQTALRLSAQALARRAFARRLAARAWRLFTPYY